MKRKAFAMLLSFLVLAAMLASCAGPKGGADEIVFGIAQDLDDDLDPHKMISAGTKEIMFNVFEGLLKPTTEGELVPAVCESYSVSEDRLSYTFILREGVKFHNGAEVKSDDVVYSILRCRDEGLVPAFAIISGVEKKDAKTVVITLSEPSVEFATYLTAAIIPADYEMQSTQPVGTGPFKFVSRVAQDNIVLERFDDYWGEKAGVAKVTLKIIENADSLVLSLQSGSVDIASHLTAQQVAQLGDGFRAETDTMKLVQALYLNNAVKPFDDIRVRRALSYAIDKHEIIDVVFGGYGSPIGSSMYPAFAKYYVPELTDYYMHDVEKAKSLLSEAGYPNGFSMTITVPSNYQPHIDTATVIVNQLKAVGVTAEIKLIEWASWLEDVYGNRDFESTVVGFDAAQMTARALLERFTSTHKRNFINYSSETYDALFAKAMITYDDAEQTEIYKQMERELTENAANVYIQDLADLVALRKGLTGVRFYPIDVIDLSGLHFES
ncbi:MAG: ABC transporter substrate-binding protein [Oscillospiraceae bacterium]|nr:ABC transporter substrate-binding protein [Oscillospiraceae bacterium]